MDKKDLRFYESPVVEVVDMEAEGQILAGSAATDPFDDSTADTPVME